jgi:hypothetical protein
MLNEKETILDEKNEIERKMNAIKKDWEKRERERERKRGEDIMLKEKGGRQGSGRKLPSDTPPSQTANARPVRGQKIVYFWCLPSCQVVCTPQDTPAAEFCSTDATMKNGSESCLRLLLFQGWRSVD